MSARFEYGEGEPWYPESEVYDWREIWLEKSEGQERKPLFLILDEDNYTQQINEQNTMVFLHQADDDMDAVAIIDERDGNIWWYFRGLHSNFFDLVTTVGSYSTVINNDCPQEAVERNYLRVSQEIGHIMMNCVEVEEVDEPILTDAEIEWFWKEVEG